MKDEKFKLTFRGFLMVQLMEFDYNGVHHSYHGRKLEYALDRLINFQKKKLGGGVPKTHELVIWGQAVHDWKIAQGEKDA